MLTSIPTTIKVAGAPFKTVKRLMSAPCSIAKKLHEALEQGGEAYAKMPDLFCST